MIAAPSEMWQTPLFDSLTLDTVSMYVECLNGRIEFSTADFMEMDDEVRNCAQDEGLKHYGHDIESRDPAANQLAECKTSPAPMAC